MHGLVRLRELVWMRWLLGAGALSLAVVVTGTAAGHRGHHHRSHRSHPAVLERRHCIDFGPRHAVVAEPVPVAEAAPVAMHPIELEKRWLLGHADAASIDEALRTHVLPWEPFLYLLDSQPRQAVAGPVHHGNEIWDHEFAQDRDGGIWLVRSGHRIRKGAPDPTYDVEIFLLPVGASFRGVLAR